MPSKALEVNLAISRVDVCISEKYRVLQEVMSRYHGVMEGLNVFLKELCHPYRNWPYIVKEARGYALDYHHLIKIHPNGPEAAALFADIFFEAMDTSQDVEVKQDAVGNLLLYLQKIIKDSGKEFPRFLVVLDEVFDRAKSYEGEAFFFFVKSFYQLNRLARELLKVAPPERGYRSINSLLIKYFRHTYAYWLGEEPARTWFHMEAGHVAPQSKDLSEIFRPISHTQLKEYEGRVVSMARRKDQNSRAFLEELLTLPGCGQIVDIYRETPPKLLKAGEELGEGMYWKSIFLFHMMNSSGLSSIHEETLRDINRTLTWLIGHEETRDVQKLIQKTFAILERSFQRYPATALNCVLNMGKAVYKTDKSELVDFFIDSVVGLGFQSPELKGVGDDWQVRANSAHIQNIRTWLELIALNPKWSKKLLSSLVIHLSICGIFIKDTDLFPRDISRFLNSDIGPVLNLAKQLTRLFPAYFNEIGAEGQLRDISTRLDEICLRKDALIHFLRKQSHVESSNRIIGLVEAILDFWRTKDKKGLEPFVPPYLYQQIELEGVHVDGVRRLITHLFESDGISRTSDLLGISEGDLRKRVKGVSGVSEWEWERLELAINFYKLLNQKYNLAFLELDKDLKQIQPGTFPDLKRLQEAVSEPDTRGKLAGLLGYLERLKEVILSTEEYEIRENIYRKRHFAVDIPSMYGSYHELKFDALGLTFRLESLVNGLFEELVENTELSLITRDTFAQIYDYLSLFYRGLKLEGILSSEMEKQLDLLAHSLQVRDFSYTQFLDIFRGFSVAVKNIVSGYYNNVHHQNLVKILGRVPIGDLISKYRPKDRSIDQEKLFHRVSEIFLRERIASTLGLLPLDLFLSRILTTLFEQSDKLPKEGLRLLLNYDPQKAVTPLNPINKRVSDIIYLGNKGLNLAKLSAYGFPVPPGFIITTEVFRCREVIDHYTPANQNFKEQVARELGVLEKLTGKSFGQPKNPLLLSVRSGAPISQPGMMDTFLDVGVNEEVVYGLVARTKQEWFAWDCYRRFLQSYGMAFGLTRDDFDAIISEHKKRIGVDYKKDLTGEQMKAVALTYKNFIRENGIRVEEDPFEQLHVAISKAFHSWNSTRAQTYRRIMGISHDWGSAVTVQQMVFGNYSQVSGSGVVFTHSPRWSDDVVFPWGDFSLGNQGEDVVSGLVKTLPISQRQAEVENRESDVTLEANFPEIYQKVRDLAKHLIYTKKWVPQEMEFTFETPKKERLYFLQTRDMAIIQREKVPSFVTTPETDTRLLGHGIGVSGGAMVGRAVYTSEEIRRWREKEKDTPLILVRGDTVPDDIQEIYEADGLLTARGGPTSHAAIVAHRLGRTCVVGCANLICTEKEGFCSLNHVSLKSGDWLSIDGLEGSIYSGIVKMKETEKAM